MRAQILSVLAIAAVAVWTGCASPGAPMPPSLRLPKPVQDLSAVRKGNHVLLTWTPPTQTTDSENIRHAGKTLVCRTAERSMTECGTPAATISDAQVEHWVKSTMVARKDYTDTIPDEVMRPHPFGFAIYALEDQNPKGKSAGLSNQVRVSLAPTLPPPSYLKADITNEGVLLSWPPQETRLRNRTLGYVFRVFRQSGNKPELIVGDVPVKDEVMTFLDSNIDWEQQYSYRIAAITRAVRLGQETVEVEGDDSPRVTVTTHDVFPPDRPTELQAVFSGPGQKPFIDLTWAPNTEGDLSGYNVYRHETGSAPVKINSQTVKTPSYRDPNVQAGREYYYAVSAVDERGNESLKSEETSERVP